MGKIMNWLSAAVVLMAVSGFRLGSKSIWDNKKEREATWTEAEAEVILSRKPAKRSRR